MNEEKKVDESWKNKIQKERSPEQAADEPEKSADAKPDQESSDPVREMPPADFGLFVSGLGMQALMSLGEIENPLTSRREQDLDTAKYLIDTLEMLQKKTRGNLTPEENDVLEQMMYELRMKYLALSK